MAISNYQKWIIGVLLSIATIVNVWASMAFISYRQGQETIKNRISKLENEQLTKEDLQEMNCNLLERIDARFDKFELYLSDKYKIKAR